MLLGDPLGGINGKSPRHIPVHHRASAILGSHYFLAAERASALEAAAVWGERLSPVVRFF